MEAGGEYRGDNGGKSAGICADVTLLLLKV